MKKPAAWGAMDKADDQVEELFRQKRFQTVEQPDPPRDLGRSACRSSLFRASRLRVTPPDVARR